jgi:hypothetical protein
MTHPHPHDRALEAAARALEEVQEQFTAECSIYIAMDHERFARAAVTAYLAEAGDGWMPIETAPKTDATTMRAIPFLGWCLDRTSPIGGDIRVIWWEPTMQRADETQPRARWYGDRDMEEHPILWRPLPAPPAAQEPRP